jgi:CO dehydrogenase/acetyl-CoA synthase epsilon subunit
LNRRNTLPRRIDIWWRGKENGSLMLILAHLLTNNWEWARSAIRIIRRVSKVEALESARRNLTELVESARIAAAVDVVVSDAPFAEVFRAESHDATVIFLGFNPVENDQAAAFHQQFAGLLASMPTALLISSSGEADLLA